MFALAPQLHHASEKPRLKNKKTNTPLVGVLLLPAASSQLSRSSSCSCHASEQSGLAVANA